MAARSGGNLEESSMGRIKEMRQKLESRIEAQHATQMDLLASLQSQIPNVVSSVDLSLKVVCFFNNREFTPTPIPPPSPNPNRNLNALKKHRRSDSPTRRDSLKNDGSLEDLGVEKDKGLGDGCGSPLNVVRSMVAVCLLQRVPFVPIDSATVLRKLDNDPNVKVAEKTALREVGGESGGIMAVEMALRFMAEENGGVELEEFVVSGKSRVMVLGIDRSKLVREFPESSQHQDLNSFDDSKIQVGGGASGGSDFSGGVFGIGSSPGSRQMQDMWDPMSQMFQPPGTPGHMMFPRGVPRGMNPMMMGMPRVMGINPLSRPPFGPNMALSAMPPKIKSEEDDLKDLEALLNKKSFKEQQKSKTGEELLDLIHRPTAKETAVAAKFKTKGGSQLKEYCTALTKEDCRRQNSTYIACEKVHFRRIIAPHTDMNLGDCSFLDTCRHMKTCKYVHYELDPTPDLPQMMTGALTIPKSLKPQRPEYCSEAELGDSQWINCDIRNFRMDILGQFGVIMADPPWDIHMELPYGTMADDEMKNLNVPALQTDGLIFLWVTGRAMELGRDCLELWGYKRVEEIIWVKTNQLQRIIRTGRTGHWLNHSKEHCLVGIKGNPEVNRNIDTDVIVAEVRETSRKPDEMYPLLERISPRTRKLELFARMHNTHSGWMSLGNQLSGVRLVDEGLRARFKAAYPDVEVEPASPPRASSMEVDHMRSPFTGGMESKTTAAQFPNTSAPESTFNTQAEPMTVETEMVS